VARRRIVAKGVTQCDGIHPRQPDVADDEVRHVAACRVEGGGAVRNLPRLK
jgi:hypothetical protein